MALLELDNNSSQYQIEAYEPGCVRINGVTYMHSVIVTPTQLIDNWPPQCLTDLTDAALLTPILALKPAILLLGTGGSLQFPPLALYGELINQGIGVEIMDTAAACRTFSALSAENRDVAAALIIV